jgi:hypothetical protein
MINWKGNLAHDNFIVNQDGKILANEKIVMLLREQYRGIYYYAVMIIPYRQNYLCLKG